MSLSHLIILVVDDEAEIREIIIDELASHNAKTVGVSDGKAAFELLKNKKFDVVISDIRMPSGDGIELAKNIKTLDINKPKVFLATGFSDLSQIEAEKIGVIEIFQKPFDFKKIVDSIIASFGK